MEKGLSKGENFETIQESFKDEKASLFPPFWCCAYTRLDLKILGYIK